eukprot:7376028-Prymnesium_polylepis.1
MAFEPITAQRQRTLRRGVHGVAFKGREEVAFSQTRALQTCRTGCHRPNNFRPPTSPGAPGVVNQEEERVVCFHEFSRESPERFVAYTAG